MLVAALPVGVAAIAGPRLDLAPTAAAVAVGAVALAAGPLLPRTALWLSGLPRPFVPGDATELADADDGPDLLPPAELAARAALARGYLAGLVGGCAVLAAAAALPATAHPGWTGPAFAAVTAVLLGLRSRSFVDTGPARTVLACALAAAIGPAVLAGWTGGPGARALAAIGLLLASALVTLVDADGRSAGSPVRRRAVDLGENLLTAAVLPLAAGVLDLYRLVREF